MVRGDNDPLYLKFCKEIRKINSEFAKNMNLPETKLEKLLREFESMNSSVEINKKLTNQERGLKLEKFITEMFECFNINAEKGFIRKKGAQQIDGKFKLDGNKYVIECKWTKAKTSSKDISVFKDKVNHSGDQILGLFISINGFASTVREILNVERGKICLMDGDDLRYVLMEKVNLNELLLAKFDQLNFQANPYYKADQFLKENKKH